MTNPDVTAGAAASLLPEDRVIGVSINGESRAYPLKILNWHKIVNDTLGGMPVVITYCPLCDSAVAFNRTVEKQVLEFGVSGLLYQSNVLMYDRSRGPQSLWSQLMFPVPAIDPRLPAESRVLGTGTNRLYWCSSVVVGARSVLGIHNNSSRSILRSRQWERSW